MGRPIQASDEKEPNVYQDHHDIRQTIDKTTRYIRSRFLDSHPTGGWRQFLNEGGPPSVTGTACVLTTLARVGVTRGDDQIQKGLRLLTENMRADGGWSKPELNDHLSLSLVTCLALNAYNALGFNAAHTPVHAGVNWVVHAPNSDGGWGAISRDGQSNVTATSYAIRTLCQNQEVPGAPIALQHGIEWLREQQTPSGSWGIDLATEPTVAHTSHAIEALLEAGFTPSDLTSAQEWLLAELRPPFTPWVEHYNFSHDLLKTSSSNLKSSRLSWTHLPSERCLLALLKLGVDPTSDIIQSLLHDLSARYSDDGYWLVKSVPGTAPAWAVLEAIAGIRLYGERLDQLKHYTHLRRTTEIIERRLEELTETSSILAQDVIGLTSRLDHLESQLVLHRRSLRVAYSALQRTASSTRARVVMAVIVTGVVAFLYMTVWSPADPASERAIGIATILATSIAVITLIARKGHS